MTKYVALLRGISPGNPNMRNDKLRGVFEGLGLGKVQSVISSGNIIFTSDRTDMSLLETDIEQAITKELGFTTVAIVRNQSQLQKLVAAKPYGDLVHGPSTYLLATFFKKPTKVEFKLPYQPADKPYQLLKVIDNTLFTVTDTTAIKTPDVMAWLEKEFTKAISSRTWLTAQRILKKFE